MSLWGQFKDREASSSLLEGNEERMDSEGWPSGCGRVGGWDLTVGLLVRHPLGAAEAVQPGPRRFLTWAYRLPSRGPLVWQMSGGNVVERVHRDLDLHS